MPKHAGKYAIKVMLAATIAAPSFHADAARAYEQLIRPFASHLSIPHLRERADFFGGIDGAKAVTFAWVGATYAPAGTLAEDGWRLRFMGGAGRYSYQTAIVPGGINDANLFSVELLGGYRKTFDNLFGSTLYAGAFAGVHYEDQILAHADPFNQARGSEAGIKGSLELYSRLWQRYIATAFGSASTVHRKYYAKAALLYELNETWAFGGEAATMGDARYSEHRAGLAASFTWRRKIFVLSAGALENSGRGTGAYTTFSVYSPF